LAKLGGGDFPGQIAFRALSVKTPVILLFYLDEFGEGSMKRERQNRRWVLDPAVFQWFILAGVGIPETSRKDRSCVDQLAVFEMNLYAVDLSYSAYDSNLGSRS